MILSNITTGLNLIELLTLRLDWAVTVQARQSKCQLESVSLLRWTNPTVLLGQSLTSNFKNMKDYIKKQMVK